MTSVCSSTEEYFYGDGSTNDFSFQFDYIKRSDVKVALYNVSAEEWQDQDTTTYEFVSHKKIEFRQPPPPSTDPNVKIYRTTNIDPLKSEFLPGSAIRAQDLNDNFNQLRFAIQDGNCAGGGGTGTYTFVRPLKDTGGAVSIDLQTINKIQ